jgi:hypothetical protein
MFELRDSADFQTMFSFNQGKIVIGDAGDFNISSGHLGQNHAIIEWKNERYVIENKAHDPHTLINRKPFWKKKLENGDLIQLGNSEFVFHQISDCHFNPLEEAPTATKKIHTIDEVLHPSTQTQRRISQKKTCHPLAPFCVSLLLLLPLRRLVFYHLLYHDYRKGRRRKALCSQRPCRHLHYS